MQRAPAKRHERAPGRLGQRVRELRAARGLTQAQLAGSELTKGFISQIESGISRPSLRAAQVLAVRLGVSVDELLDDATSGKQTQLRLLEAERELASGSPERALRAARELKAAGVLRARALRLQGRALVALDRPADAVPMLERAHEAFRAARDDDGRTRSLYDLAFAHARLDHAEKALVLALECESALRSGATVDRTLELQVETLLAAAHVRLGDHLAAEPHVERAERLAEDVVDHEALASLYAQLAAVQQQRGDLDRALALAQRSVAELERLGRLKALAEAWHNIAAVHVRRNEVTKARAALSHAQDLAESTGNERLQRWIAVTKARLAVAAERPQDAAALLDAVIGDRVTSTLARAEAHLLRAELLGRRKAPLERIREEYDAALKALAAEPAGVRARALRLYANALAARGATADAFEKANAALELLRPIVREA